MNFQEKLIVYITLLLIEFANIRISELDDSSKELTWARNNDEAANILLANCNIRGCLSNQLHISKTLSIPLNAVRI